MADMSTVSFSTGFERHKSGRSDVQFSPDGRLIQGGPASLPEAHPSPERLPNEIDDYRSYDAHRERRRKRRSHHEHRGTYYDRQDLPGRYTQNSNSRRPYTMERPDLRPDPRSFEPRHSHVDKRYSRDYRDDFATANRYQDRRRFDAPLPTRKRRTQGKCCSSRNPFSFIFIFVAILILGCAMCNVLMCRDYHYYCGFWAGIFVLEFGIIGAFHRGNYKHQCRNWSYIILGFLSTIMAYIGSAMVCEKLIPDIIYLTQNKNEMYIQSQTQLMPQPYVNGNFSDTQRAWLCLAVDSSLVALFVFDYISLLAVSLVMDKFYNAVYKVTGKVEPWCYPVCFNPYGQVPLGQFVAFLGIVVRYACVHAEKETPWYRYWAPVWAGTLLIIGGTLSATSMKRPDQRGRAGFTLSFQFISVVACIGAFVIQILGIVDSATYIESTKDAGIVTDNDHYVGSILVYSLSALFLLLSIVFSVSLFIKVAFAVCDNDDQQQPYHRENRSYSDSNSSFDRPPVFPRRDPTRGYSYGADYYGEWQRY